MSGEMTLPSGCVLEHSNERLLRFCLEEYDYYDGISTTDANLILPIDVLATVAVNSYVNNATAIRDVHRGLASRCGPLLSRIPEDADLLSLDPALDLLKELLHEAIQVRRVLIPVATKVLYRKRRSLIPMLDNVVIGYYLGAPARSVPSGTQEKARAAAYAIRVLKAFRGDLLAVHLELRKLRQTLAGNGYWLTPVRILELLIWMQMKEQGYYRRVPS